jgi:hypothetical protein
MKTITIGKEDARCLNIPAGVKVQIKKATVPPWSKSYEIYWKGEYAGRIHLREPQGAGR